MTNQFFLAMVPPTVTDQQKRIGVSGKHRWVYKQAELMDARSKFVSYLTAHRPDEPLSGAVRLTTKWCWPASKAHPHGTYKTSKPDTENALKMFKDVMTDLGFWHDDAQVASEITEKFHSNTPGIFVSIEELPQ